MIKIDWNNFILDKLDTWTLFGFHVVILIRGGPASSTPDKASIIRRLGWSWQPVIGDTPNWCRVYKRDSNIRFKSKTKAWLRRCEEIVPGCTK